MTIDFPSTITSSVYLVMNNPEMPYMRVGIPKFITLRILKKCVEFKIQHAKELPSPVKRILQ